MIEQTELVVSKWEYTPPQSAIEDEEKILNTLSLNVMKKKHRPKKVLPADLGAALYLKMKRYLNTWQKILM